MDDVSFDTLTRRVSFVAAAAYVAALASPSATAAKHKHKHTSTTEKARNKCVSQADQCRGYFESICGGNTDCLERPQLCCPVAGGCDFTGFINCMTTGMV